MKAVNIEILEALGRAGTLARIFAEACDRAKKEGEDRMLKEPQQAANWGVLYMSANKAEALHLAYALRRELLVLVKSNGNPAA